MTAIQSDKQREKMKKILLITILSLLLVPTSYSARLPTGSFSFYPLSPREGDYIVFKFGKIEGVTNNYEVTLGVWCFLPDGSQIRWGNRSNPYIYEYNSFGNVYSGYTTEPLYLPIFNTGYSCTSRLVAVLWKKGNPVQAWTLDEESFSVTS